jgi:hypothetical protein
MLLIMALFRLLSGSFQNQNYLDLSGQAENQILNKMCAQYNVTHYYAVRKII